MQTPHLHRQINDFLSARMRGLFSIKLRSVYKELHADHETGAADNK